MNGPSESFYLVSFFLSHVYCVKLNFRSKNSDILIADIHYYTLTTFEIVNAILIYDGIQFTFLMQTNWNLVSKSGIIFKAKSSNVIRVCCVCVCVLLGTARHLFGEIPDFHFEIDWHIIPTILDYYDIQFGARQYD